VYSPHAQDPASQDDARIPGRQPQRDLSITAAAAQLALNHGEHTTEAVVDLDAIAANLRIYREQTDVALMAVVKADGYGHGAVPVARTALAHGAGWLGVSFSGEALALRAAGIRAPILAFMHQPEEDTAQALFGDVDLPVSTPEQLAGIAACAERVGRTAQVHLKVDTGLHRNGASLADWPALTEAAARFEEQGLIHVRALWSHMVRTLEPQHPVSLAQFDAFDEAIAVAAGAGLADRIAHIASSATGLTVPRARHQLIRVGSSMYGVETAPDRKFGFVPAMTLRTKVILTRPVGPGEGVSYEHRYKTTEAGKLAVLPLGYADGLPRNGSDTGQVWIAGARRPIAGWITMTSSVADAGPAEVEVGDEVVVFGTGAQGEPTVVDWAEWAGTGTHEVLTRISPFIPRRYLPVAAEHDERAEEGRLRVVVLFGGPGGEYDISCESGATIVGNLDRSRYAVQPVRISPEGRWIPGPADLPAGKISAQVLLAATPDPAVRAGAGHEEALRVLAAADVVIPALHGPFGEDGTVQALMDVLGVRYVGCGMQASVLGMDKDAAKRVLITNGLRVAEWATLHRDGEELGAADRERLGLPVFVKPARAGSSVGVSRVAGWDEFETALATAHKWDGKVLVEQSVVGREMSVAVLEHPDGRIEASAPAETILNEGRHDFLDYSAKYQDEEAIQVLIPADLDPELTAELQRQSVRAFELLGCRGLARVDFLLRDGVEPVFNEINTFPGFSSHSIYPRLWAHAGIPLPQLLDELVDAALARVPA
jgi:alanine racemase